MKTRTEMVYDFMLALSSGFRESMADADAMAIRKRAERLADQYLEFISGVN